MSTSFQRYRGRLAPTPSGYIHVGNASTFAITLARAQAHPNYEMVLRVEDLDQARCKPEYIAGLIEDLKWAGFSWTEGPDLPGHYGPYYQSQRQALYLDGWKVLCDKGLIYPCHYSRRELMSALDSDSESDTEMVFPASLRPESWTATAAPGGVNWRFKVPDGRRIQFRDLAKGLISYTAGEDFGDFLVWRKDGFPSYELAVVLDDHAMEITEVVRGEDLLMSTARQILIYEAMGWSIPEFYHCSLIYDASGRPLAKRHGSLSLRHLRDDGIRDWRSCLSA